MSNLRLAIITDIHHGRNDETKHGEKALDLLSAVLAQMQEYKPDLVVDLGDRITDEDAGTDRRLSREVAERFERVEVPRVHLIGNHDVEFLPRTFHESLLGTPVSHHSVHRNGWHLIFWHGTPHYRKGNLNIAPDDLAWLENAISEASYPAVVFTHVPVDGGSTVGNYYFEDRPEGRAEYYNGAEARALITGSDSVVLTVSGHTHWNKLTTIDGVHFVSLQSLTEGYNSSSKPAGAWMTLELGKRIRVNVHGNDPLALELTPRTRGFRSLKRQVKRSATGANGTGAVAPMPERVRGVLLDLDGVIYSGTTVLPGAQSFLEHVRANRIQLVALTNHAGRRASDIEQKLRNMGISVQEKEILTAGWATARYVADRKPGAGVFVVGESALTEEMQEAGLQVCGGEDPHCDCVVVGYCSEFNRAQMETATRFVLAGAELIGTNPDRLLPTQNGPIPACGPLISFLEYACSTKATVIGKPNPRIAELALARMGIPAEESVIVGDNPETDIETGRRSGIATIWINGDDNPQASLTNSETSGATATFSDLAEVNDWLFRGGRVPV